MPTAYSKGPVLSEEEKYQLHQQQLEQELVLLRREYTVLDRERASSQFTGFKKLTKYSRVVDIFKSEYENILNDLGVAAAPGKRRIDNITYEQLSELLHEYVYFQQQTKEQKTYLEELEGEIRMVGKAVQGLRKQQITDRQYEARIHSASQTLETLENKLEVQMTKFNVTVAKNYELRDEIDHLLWDRRNFLTVWKKLIDKLSAGKRIMLDLIEQATLAYDQREEWCTKLQLLRITVHKDLISNIDQMRAYRQKVDNAKKLEQFYTTKGRKRVMRDLMMKEAQKREERKRKLENKLEHYAQLMNDILDFSNHVELKEIARKYYNREAQNFTRFKYITDLITEMEFINDRLGFLHFEIDEQRAIHQARAQSQQDTLENLETDVENVTKVTQEAEDDLEKMNSCLDVLMNGIMHLFRICKCSEDPLMELLGDNSTIKAYNVLLFINILEQAVHESLIKAGYKDSSITDKTSVSRTRILNFDTENPVIYPIEKLIPADPCSLCVEYEMVSDVIDVVQYPWTKDEAKRKLKQRLALPDGNSRLHTVSKCFLPQARRMMQQRYC